MDTSVQFLTIEQVTKAYPFLTRSKLAQLRYEGKGPTHYKPTPRTVLYDTESITIWIRSGARTDTKHPNHLNGA